MFKRFQNLKTTLKTFLIILFYNFLDSRYYTFLYNVNILEVFFLYFIFYKALQKILKNMSNLFSTITNMFSRENVKNLFSIKKI